MCRPNIFVLSNKKTALRRILTQLKRRVILIVTSKLAINYKTTNISYHKFKQMSRDFLKKGVIFLDETLAVFLRSGYPTEAEGADLLKINEETLPDGLALSHAEALELAQTHRKALDACGRIEIGTDTVQKIIRAFSRSHYLWQKDYADTINEAVEAFYELKNEADDHISDDDLIRLLADGFERYKGSLAPFLQSRELNRLLRALRFGEDYDADADADKLDEDEKEEPDE